MSNADAPSPDSIAADDALLKQYAAAIVDVLAMDSTVHTLFDQEISVILPDRGDSEETSPKGLELSNPSMYPILTRKFQMPWTPHYPD